MNFGAKFGLALMIIAGGGIILTASQKGSLQAGLSSVHTPLLFVGADAYFVNR